MEFTFDSEKIYIVYESGRLSSLSQDFGIPSSAKFINYDKVSEEIVYHIYESNPDYVEGYDISEDLYVPVLDDNGDPVINEFTGEPVMTEVDIDTLPNKWDEYIWVPKSISKSLAEIEAYVNENDQPSIKEVRESLQKKLKDIRANKFDEVMTVHLIGNGDFSIDITKETQSDLVSAFASNLIKILLESNDKDSFLESFYGMKDSLDIATVWGDSNGMHPLTLQQLIQVGSTLAVKGSKIHYTYGAKSDLLNNCQTVEQLLAVDLESGWDA